MAIQSKTEKKKRFRKEQQWAVKPLETAAIFKADHPMPPVHFAT